MADLSLHGVAVAVAAINARQEDVVEIMTATHGSLLNPQIRNIKEIIIKVGRGEEGDRARLPIMIRALRNAPSRNLDPMRIFFAQSVMHSPYRGYFILVMMISSCSHHKTKQERIRTITELLRTINLSSGGKQ